MKLSFRIIPFAGLAAFCLCGQLAYAGARPVVGGLFNLSLFDAKTAVGEKDGMLRLLFDYNPSNGGASTYAGSALWIIDPNGSVVTTGSPLIPASVGASFTGGLVGNFERSNTAIFAQADGNTTVLFYYAFNFSSNPFPNSFAVWTYNSSGALVAAANYGPFSGVQISGLYFDPSGKIIARWRAGSSASSPVAGWVLDEFGTIANATSFFGSFGSTFLGKIRINSSGQQIWPFSFRNSSGQYVTTIWTFSSSGVLTNAQVYGPF